MLFFFFERRADLCDLLVGGPVEHGRPLRVLERLYLLLQLEVILRYDLSCILEISTTEENK
jgi:hypothetical protein